MEILIINGRLIDPVSGFDDVTDILIEDSEIKKIGSGIGTAADKIIDARGMWVVPGLIDLHVHFRDPGFEHKEDILSGAAAAAAGGFTSVCVMPNTKPVTDNAEVVDYIVQKSKQAGLVNVIPCGSVTKNQDGLELSDMESMAAKGIMAVSEDGKSVTDTLLLKKALEECKKLDIAMLSHCEDSFLSKGGVINDSAAQRLNLQGIPSSAEDVIVARDVILAEETGARLHICHVSTKTSVEIIRQAKKRGPLVTAEAAPHHFIFSEEDITGSDTNYKMNPPLRSKQDVTAVISGLIDGTIECIATDHAPHSQSEKSGGFTNAANGIIGLETSVPLSITYLVKKDMLTPAELIEKMSVNPAKVLKLNRGYIKEGSIADITIINPDEEFIIDSSKFKSKSTNTPFDGMRVTGKVKYTILNGKVVYEDI